VSPRASGSDRCTSRELSHPMSPRASGSGRCTSKEPSHPVSPRASGSGRCTYREPPDTLWVSELVCKGAVIISPYNNHIQIASHVASCCTESIPEIKCSPLPKHHVIQNMGRWKSEFLIC
jgi:hypothetical protein